MSSSTPTHRLRRSLRPRLTALASLTALALFGALALAGPAHADFFVSMSIDDSADPVQAGTPYTYTVTVDVLHGGYSEGELTSTTTLTGSAATITGASTNFGPACDVCTTTVSCPLGEQGHFNDPEVISIQVTPTAAGTVSAATVVSGFANASDTETTEITNPAFPFTGFFSPIDNPPTVNSMNAGRAVPVKFSLGGDEGLNIFTTGSPSSQQVNCSTGAPIDDVEETVTAGNSGLTYNAATDQYTYVWKTNKAWDNTCRTLDLHLTDGTHHTANFTFN